MPADLPLMLDTTGYVHRLPDKVPPAIHILVEGQPVLHCAVAVAEIAVSVGIMDPTHATTRWCRTRPVSGGPSHMPQRHPGLQKWPLAKLPRHGRGGSHAHQCRAGV